MSAHSLLDQLVIFQMALGPKTGSNSDSNWDYSLDSGLAFIASMGFALAAVPIAAPDHIGY